MANGETAFRPGGLNNLAVFKSRYGLCRSVMMNKRSAISGTVKAIIDVPWSALNPETNEGQSLRILFDNDYTVIFKVRMSLLIIISLLISLRISCILRSLIGPWSLADVLSRGPIKSLNLGLFPTFLLEYCRHA